MSKGQFAPFIFIQKRCFLKNDILTALYFSSNYRKRIILRSSIEKIENTKNFNYFILCQLLSLSFSKYSYICNRVSITIYSLNTKYQILSRRSLSLALLTFIISYIHKI